ncbi:E3 ubiquitin-protein ligase TRAF7 [Holothuria leucospilota]|uniref:E3 ubiquitin-protein ligase TRAF7 n=1 Tax=Holothuria leucospilota TaxID=206669 RepID=A0A9Q1CND5_HOLLE|nr:E3 ubiquitin-protein ligase TRAF7 [Holothuria leucospilota]
MEQSTSKRKDCFTCVPRELRSSKRKRVERELDKRTKENPQSATSGQAAGPEEVLLIGEECTGKKSQFLTELKSKYRILCGGIQPVRFQCDKCDIDKLFVSSRIKFLEEIYGEPINQERWANLVDYKAIFTDPRTKSKRRIIDGRPGYGKSMLALKITNDWCKGRAPMKEFQVLILLQLKQFRNVPSIYSAIKMFLLPKDSTLTEDDIKDILDGSSTMVLLDGYDEYPERENKDTDISHILQGDMFQKHEVVLITRTSCLPPDHTNATIKRIQLTGFDEPSRERYIQKVVAPGRPGIASKLSRFFKVCSVPASICRTPLLFVMMCHMVKKSGRLQNFMTVTQCFNHIIKCFHNHKEVMGTEGNQDKELDHSKLDQVAFEGLSGNVQQISWDKDKLIGQIGKDLYAEYVRIGILIEEESFNYDSLEYYTRTGFYHKMIAEWYAAHHLARVATQPEVKLGPCQKPLSEANDHTENRGTVFDISLNPHEDLCVYRYACGLSPVAAQKITTHLGNGDIDQNTLLCMAEYSGSLASIEETVTLLCSRGIKIRGTHSSLLQKSTVTVMEFASSRKPGPDITVFVEPPNEKLFCLLCKNVFRDPVITECGHTYCKQCATSKHFSNCPVDNNNLSWTIHKNILVRELVEELVIHCRYGCKLSDDKSGNKYEVDPDGCPCTFPMKDRSKHESHCGFASRSCLSNTGCPP